MSALISFFGGTFARWLFAELLGIIKAREDRRGELEMLTAQQAIERERHEWQRQGIADAAAAGVKVVEAQREASAGDFADRMTLEALTQIGRPSGVAWVDAWNGAIRPALATAAILLIVGNALAPGRVVLTGVVMEVVAGILGLYIGGRIHATGR